MNDSTNLERIRILLDNYVDVEAQGLRDGRGEGEHLPLMSRAWNHPSYAELDRLLGRMKSRRWSLYWHVAQTYFWPSSKRVLVCQHPHCEVTYPAWASISFHRHGRRSIALVPAVVRTVNPNVSTSQLGAGLAWLEREWHGEVFLPDELLSQAV